MGLRLVAVVVMEIIPLKVRIIIILINFLSSDWGNSGKDSANPIHPA